MKDYELLDAIGGIDAEFINAADRQVSQKKTGRMIVRVAVAACLCLAAGSIFYFTVLRNQKENHVQLWDSSYSAESYFRYSQSEQGSSSSDGKPDQILSYAEIRYYSDKRELLEKNNTIPVMTTHPLFEAVANFNEDGSLYSVVLSWHRRDLDGLEHYSDLTVTASYEEIPAVSDCVFVEVDESGKILEPAVTVTERDGVRIIARGRENTEKTIAFRNDSGWYQISGSWKDSYEDVVSLFEWFWNHPVDFSWFTKESGDTYSYNIVNDISGYFSEYLPDFAAHGFVCRTASVILKNDIPVKIEAYMVPDVSKEQLENGQYTGNGVSEIQWCLNTEPDYYDREWVKVELKDLTKEQVVGLTPIDNVTAETRIRFRQNDNVVTVYATDLDRAWELISSIQK